MKTTRELYWTVKSIADELTTAYDHAAEAQNKAIQAQLQVKHIQSKLNDLQVELLIASQPTMEEREADNAKIAEVFQPVTESEEADRK